jgi:hypothetical protein
VKGTSLALGAKGKGKVVEQRGGGLPLNMLPAWLATHRAARRSLVNDDAVAAGSAEVLGPLARPASPRRDHASLDFEVLARTNQGDPSGSPFRQFDGRHLIAVDEGSCAVPALGSELSAERDGLRLVAEPPSKDSPWPDGSFSFLPNESVRSFLHRHHLPPFDFADGFFADGEWLLRPPFSAVPADTSRMISNASSGLWTDPRKAFSIRSSERAN